VRRFGVNPTRRLLLVAAALSLGAAGACSGGDGSDEGASRGYVLDQLAARAGSTSRITFYDSIDELLPSVSFQVDSQPPRPLVAGVVVGRVTDVDAGRGFVSDGADAAGGRPVDISDPNAVWRTVHLIVDVDERIGSAEPRESIKVGLAFNGGADVKSMKRGLKNLGTVLLFLERSSPVFSYDRSLYSIVEDGALLATVGAKGTITLPLKEPAQAAALLEGAATIAALRQDVVAGPRVIRLTVEGGVPRRTP